MTTWNQIPNHEVPFYGVSREIAEALSNQFFTIKHGVLEGQPFLAFLHHVVAPSVVTLQIYTFDEEDDPDSGFNPLDMEGGYLRLDQQTGKDLVILLREQAQHLSSTSLTSQKMFRIMDFAEAADFRLEPDRFPGRRSYYQTYDPLTRKTIEGTVCILIFDVEPSISKSSTFFRIAYFSLLELQDPIFQPVINSRPQIHLDHNGLHELASLIEIHLQRLDSRPRNC
ncbi:MAG TPA: hypothetical protein VKY74_08195 [Chloroflexia bacterium]|nr:hypothetical protein [Chloroflexia bacterium]